MVRRTTLEVDVRGQNVEVEGYNTDVEGLVAHRVVRINHHDETIVENEWTVTHRGTGISCLPASWRPDTKRDAYRIAELIGPVTNWSKETLDLNPRQKDFILTISMAVFNNDHDIDKHVWIPEEQIPQYIIRPVDGIFALVKIIGGEEEIIDNYRHRGEAGIARRELANG